MGSARPGRSKGGGSPFIVGKYLRTDRETRANRQFGAVAPSYSENCVRASRTLEVVSAIPPSLTRAHVTAALARIDREGIPPRRESTKFQLVVDGRRYPPKYVISLAVAAATGRELRPQEFSGGEETNGALQRLGFTIVGPGLPTPTKTRAPQTRPQTSKSSAPLSVKMSAPRTPEPQSVVRIVVDGEPPPSLRAASELLLEAFENWPTSGRANFAVTHGGFVVGEFPSSWSGGRGWDSSASDLAALVRDAKPIVDACMTKEVIAAARARTRILTIGVDLLSEAEHAELVAVIDCDSGEIVRWTGKSYPTTGQASQLVRVSDVGSHLLEIANERVLILGCHDLNMFSARARANQSPTGARRRLCDAMVKVTKEFQPTIVLQHPHTTDTPNIWRMPWSCLIRDLRTVRAYASGINYFRWKGRPRRSLQEVLAGTRSEAGVLDVVVKSC